MDMNFLLKGAIIGFSIAAPVGPIGILCIRRTIANGRWSGLISGLGAATADGLYGIVAAYGITGISNLLVGHQFLLRLIGGLFLLYLGIKIFVSKPEDKGAAIKKSKGLLSDYLSTFVLTITNPFTIISFAAIFAGLGLGSSTGSQASAILMVAGVVLGSAVWWIILTELVGLFRLKFSPKSTRVVNQVSGAILVIFALIAFVSLAKF